MQRPLEKLGWHKRIATDNTEIYYKGKDWLDSSIYVSIKNGDIVNIRNDECITLEELQAIYETALEIKRETEMENQILCNRCENTCYYGFVKCSNFKERKK